MKPKVAVVSSDSFSKSLNMIGDISGLNTTLRDVIVKVGIYNPTTGICAKPQTLDAIAVAFNESPRILVVESDSGAGPGMERLKVWQDCFNNRVVPFNLSDDPKTEEVSVAGETVPFSSVFFSDGVIISTHVPRRYEKAGLEDLMNLGFNIKNLLGLILDTKKNRFHDVLPKALIDMYEIIGGLDLAVLDATDTYLGYSKKRVTVNTNVLIVGKDAFAVEAVGMYMVGMNPLENPVLREAKKRGLGEINLKRIDVIGDVESLRQLCCEEFEELREW